VVRRELFFIGGIFVAERSSGSYFSEGRKPERRSGPFFSGIGITDTYPSPTEFLATMRSGTYLFKNNSTACIPIVDVIDMFGEGRQHNTRGRFQDFQQWQEARHRCVTRQTTEGSTLKGFEPLKLSGN
jgi:hypothetical protein